MNDSAYNSLVKALDRRGGAFPAIQSSGALRRLLEIIFTEEEAVMVASMPFTPFTPEELAMTTGKPVEVVKACLDGMVKKGIVIKIMVSSTYVHMLLPMIPGIIEGQLVTNIKDERSRQVAEFTDAYVAELIDLEMIGDERLPKVPFARVLPVEQGIQSGSTVQPYDSLIKQLDDIKDFAVGACHCRHAAELTGTPCTKPKDVCLLLGQTARYLTEYGMAKSISKAEALEILKMAEEHGLVHVTNNVSGQLSFICNCCICHCEALRSMKRSRVYAKVARASLLAEVQTADCAGCGKCLPRCPMEAISMQDDVAFIDREGCIGCGLCVTDCPSEVITMTNSDSVAEPYQDVVELYQAMQLSRKVL